LIVVDEDSKFLGILTRRDVRIPSCLSSEIKKVEDAMTKKADALFAQEGISRDDAEKTMYLNGRKEKLPILKEDGSLAGLMTLKDLQTDYPNAATDDEGRLLCALAISPFKPEKKEDFETLKEIDNHVDIYFTDVAHIHKDSDFHAVKELMDELDSLFVLGNIGTYQAMEDLINEFREYIGNKLIGVRAGIGSGSICNTSIKTRYGAPTIYATACAADAIHTYNLQDKLIVMADGGFEQLGHPTAAFIVGAGAIISGKLFSGTTESPGYIDTIEGRKVKVYRGMGSKEARAKEGGGMKDRYADGGRGIAQGVSGYVPYVGDLMNVIGDMTSALSESMGNYGGAVKLQDLQKSILGRITPVGKGEIAPHGLYGT
jgi:IMP dehydrogenase